MVKRKSKLEVFFVLRKLLVPKVVSYNGYTKRGYVQGGTKAFVEQGTRLPKGLKREQKWASLRELGRNADFFIKTLSKRNKKICCLKAIRKMN